MTAVTAAAALPPATLKAAPGTADGVEGFDGALSSILAALPGAAGPAPAPGAQEDPAATPAASPHSNVPLYPALPAPAAFQLPAGSPALPAQGTVKAAPATVPGLGAAVSPDPATIRAAFPGALPDIAGPEAGALPEIPADPGAADPAAAGPEADPRTLPADPGTQAVAEAFGGADPAVSAASFGVAAQVPAEPRMQDTPYKAPGTSPDTDRTPAGQPEGPVPAASQLPADPAAVPRKAADRTVSLKEQATPATAAAAAPPVAAPAPTPQPMPATGAPYSQPGPVTDMAGAAAAPLAGAGTAAISGEPGTAGKPAPVTPADTPLDGVKRAMGPGPKPEPAAVPLAIPFQAGPAAAVGAASAAVPMPATLDPAGRITVPTGFAAQVARPVFTLASAGPGDHTMTVAVNPENLGPVTVQAHISSSGVRVELFAASPDGRDVLRQILPDLKRDLAGSGLNATLDLSSGGQPGSGQGGGDGFLNRRSPIAYSGPAGNRQLPMNSQAPRVTTGLHGTDGTLDVMA